jgi:hypothetical protein
MDLIEAGDCFRCAQSGNRAVQGESDDDEQVTIPRSGIGISGTNTNRTGGYSILRSRCNQLRKHEKQI